MSFANLHGHSHYSLLDGFGTPKDIVLRAKELGYPAVALTDHGVTHGLIEFYKAAKEEGIKPILGCELYIAPRGRFDKEGKIDTKPYHLTVLAENNEGYKNLLLLVTKAHLEGFYYKPRVDYGLLKAYGKGLIALSGCMAGHLPRAILSGNDDEVEEVIKKNLEIFGKENYFLELQDHPLIESQTFVNEKLKALSKKHKIPLVITNDSHYPRPEDSDVHDILLCIQTGVSVNDENRMHYTGDFSIRPVDDIKAAVRDCPEAVSNTLKIAERCNVELEFGTNLIPQFPTPQNEKADIYLRMLCEEGLKERFGKKKVPKEYVERLDFELGVVNKMGFDTYFLIVYDVVKYAKDNGIVVGPGRGSAAGSIMAWSLKITDLDPIEHGLFFERFLNPERISMPDIDIDFADARRDEIFKYMIEKYGRENVAQVITFGTMTAKAVVRDVGRALGYPYAEVDELAKTVPAPILGKHTPLNISIKDDPDLHNAYTHNPRYKALLDFAVRLEGTVRHAGTHACAIVISEKPLTEYTAMQFGAGGGEEIITQYSAKPLEDLGLLKMDFLGLRNLTIIEKTLNFLEKSEGKKIDILDIPFDDKKAFKLFQEGQTTGVFQFESPGMKRYLKQLKPTVFEDIVAMGALYRPGPMEWIPTYIKGKHNASKVEYLHKSFKPILENTYGVAVYQEQILQIARDFAGFSLGEADILRKAVGKKIPSLLEEQREKFVKGAIKNGHDEKFGREVFDQVIEPFAGYGFNRAHAVCYGLIAYQTAYLKSRYPLEFMTALLCSDEDNMDRVVLEIKECVEMGIEVLPPTINESLKHFTLVGKNKIRFGLLAIKGVGEGPVKEIIDEREKNGVYKSLEDFARRVPVSVLNKKTLQALAYCGALDEFDDRNQIAENFEEIVSFAKHCQHSVSNGQTDIFGDMSDEESGDIGFHLHKAPKSTAAQKLKWEKEFLGMYISGHPLKGLKNYIHKKGNLIGELEEKNVGKIVKLVGVVSGIKKVLTRSGEYMVTFMLEDPTGRVGAVMFPKVYAKLANVIVEDAVIAVSGKFEFRRQQFQVSCDAAKGLSVETMVENAKELRAYDEKELSNFAVRKIDDILSEKRLMMESEVKAEDNLIEDFDVEVKPYIIRIPANVGKATLNELSELLQKFQGDVPVELHINGSKKIKLPFGVKLDKELEGKIEKLLK